MRNSPKLLESSNYHNMKLVIIGLSSLSTDLKITIRLIQKSTRPPLGQLHVVITINLTNSKGRYALRFHQYQIFLEFNSVFVKT